MAIGCRDPDATTGEQQVATGPAAGETRLASAWGLTDEQRRASLIRVGNEVMTLGFFIDTMGDDLQLWRRVNGARSANRKIAELLEQLEIEMLIARSARAAGYEQLPDARRIRKREAVALLTQALIDARGAGFHAITEEDRRRYHAEHRATFTSPAALRMSQMPFDDRAAARRILTRLLSTDDRAAVMAEIGITRARNLGIFPLDLALPVEPPHSAQQPNVPAAWRRAANTLTENGQLYPEVLAGPDGFHILRRTGARAETVKPPDQLKVTLRRGILAERRQRLLDDLAKQLQSKADVTLHLDNLKHVRVSPPSAEP